MKVFVLFACDFESSAAFAVFSSRAAAEAHKVCIENAVVTFEPDLDCIVSGRDCTGCAGREECIAWDRKWNCKVRIKEMVLDAPADPIGFEN